MADEPVVLLYCIHCHGPVTLQFDLWPSEDAGDRPCGSEWLCPFCGQWNIIEAPTGLLSVSKGHTDATRGDGD